MGQPKGWWTGPKNPRWNGGRKAEHGYVLIAMPAHPNADKKGYVREHILVMTKHLNRPLAENEVVHHLNGIRDDNRLDNLVVMTSSDHAKHHHKGLIKPNSLKNLTFRHTRYLTCACGQPAGRSGKCPKCYKKAYGPTRAEYRRQWRAKRRALGLKVT